MSNAAEINGICPVIELKSPTMTDDAFESGKWTRFFTEEGVHPFDDIEWKVTDARIVKPDGSIAFEQLGVEFPASWDSNTVNIVADKYFRVINGVRENSVKQMIGRVVKVMREWAQQQGYFNTDQDAKVYEEELCYIILHQFGTFNSPVWFNIGVPGRCQQASACFISSVDDTLDGIMGFQKSEISIFAGGSGSGANLSSLRSSWEKLSSGSYVSGTLAWMEGFDKYAKAMKSGGSTRNAAKIIVLDMDHPDILETHDGRPGFIRCKAVAEKVAHDLAGIGYGVAYDDPNSVYRLVPFQNANHSVSVSDAFMKSVRNDGEWQTVERTTGKVVRSYKARELWKEIAEAAWACGDPGIQFSDTLNEWHTTPAAGRIRSTNPCGEFACIDNTACNLAAINLEKLFDGRKLNVGRFERVVRILVTAQNAIINMAEYPTDIIASNSKKLRPIGLNYGNLGSLIMKLGYGYDSDEGRAIAARTASMMTAMAYLTSAKLAAKTKPFPAFSDNRDAMLNIMKKHASHSDAICRRWRLRQDPLGEDVASHNAAMWAEAIRLGRKYGYSVSQTSLQAPLGTVSFFMGMDTSGIEPMFSLVAYKSLVGGGSMKLVCSAVKDALVNLGYSSDAVASIISYIEENDHIEGAPGFDSSHLPVFDGAMASGPSSRCLSPMAHVNMLAAIQPLITCSISKTVNLPQSTTAEEISDIYMKAWELGVKCIALYRDKSKLSQPLVSKTSDAPPISVPASEATSAIRRELPADLVGRRHRFSIGGCKGYIIMNEYPDGSLGEVFLKLGKTGTSMAGLIDGFTQLLSLALQYGVPLDKMVRSFVHTKFEPAGITNNPQIRFADSLYDYLFKLIDIQYFGGENSGMAERLAAMANSSNEDSISPPSIPPPMELGPVNVSAPICSNCGNITRRAGTCHFCPVCGTSTGCS